MKHLIIASLVLALPGCTASIKDIDITRADQECARQCTAYYSSCIASPGAPAIGVPTSLHSACKDSFEKCIQTCPAKEK